jgi:molybdopterin synthase catalytic subunit
MTRQEITIDVQVQVEDFAVAEQERRLLSAGQGVGAIAAFTGYVRNQNAGSAVGRMELEHYPGMTEKSIERIAREAGARWSLLAVRVIHRVGSLIPGDRIVYVGVAGAHRGDAFAACEFIMDYLKTRAPFWKKEYTEQGERWVEARQSDNAAANRW